MPIALWQVLTRQAKSVPELMRDWDKNKDGQIERIELRQVVRNDLKIHAENKEIDQIFDELDTDGGGTLDLKELTKAMSRFKSAAEEAAEQEVRLRQVGGLAWDGNEACMSVLPHMHVRALPHLAVSWRCLRLAYPLCAAATLAATPKTLAHSFMPSPPPRLVCPSGVK